MLSKGTLNGCCTLVRMILGHIGTSGVKCVNVRRLPQSSAHFPVHVLPVYGADAGHRVAVTHSLSQKPVSDLPGEHGGILPLVLCYLVHHFRRSHLRLRSTDHSRFYASCLIVSEMGIDGQIKYLAINRLC